jgi:predicted permease
MILLVSHFYGSIQGKFTENAKEIRIIGLWGYINIVIAILNIIHRPVFYLKHTTGNVRTSQETHYVSATSPTG